jgi:hypothetical protein
MAKRFTKDRTLESDIQSVDIMRYTPGLATGKPGSRRSCLCEDKETYSSKCCRGYLRNQGVGQTEALPPEVTAFRKPDFSNAFS